MICNAGTNLRKLTKLEYKLESIDKLHYIFLLKEIEVIGMNLLYK